MSKWDMSTSKSNNSYKSGYLGKIQYWTGKLKDEVAEHKGA